MLNAALPSSLIVGWIATLAVIVAVSMAMGANLSTTALLLVLGVAPAIVTVLVAGGAPSPSVAQSLPSVDTKDGRR